MKSCHQIYGGKEIAVGSIRELSQEEAMQVSGGNISIGSDHISISWGNNDISAYNWGGRIFWDYHIGHHVGAGVC